MFCLYVNVKLVCICVVKTKSKQTSKKKTQSFFDEFVYCFNDHILLKGRY